MNLKGGNTVWNCVEDNIIMEREEFKGIIPHEFHYKIFKEDEGRFLKEGMHVHPYLNNLIELWPGD